MTDPWQVSPRWWRLAPRSQVEVQLGPTKTSLDDWRLDEPHRIRDYRPCISIRQIPVRAARLDAECPLWAVE